MKKSQDLQKNKRPIIITIFCILGFIFIPITLLGLILPASRDLIIQQYGFSFVLITAFTALLGLAGFIGLWMMRRWGLYAYISQAILGIGYGLLIGIPFSSSSVVGPIVIAIIYFLYFKKMS